MSFPTRERGKHFNGESHILGELKIGLKTYKEHLKREYEMVLPMTAREYLFHEDVSWRCTDEGKLLRKHAKRIRRVWERERSNLEEIAQEYGKRGMFLEKRKSEQRQLQLTKEEVLSKIYGVRDVDLEEHKSVSRAKFYASLKVFLVRKRSTFAHLSPSVFGTF